MMEAGGLGMLLFFVIGALVSFWRWRCGDRGREMLWRGITLLAGALIYIYILCPGTAIETARWLIRVLLVALLLPHVLRDIEEIGAIRRDEH